MGPNVCLFHKQVEKQTKEWTRRYISAIIRKGVDNLLLLTQLCYSIVSSEKRAKDESWKVVVQKFWGTKKNQADSFVLAKIMLQCFDALKLDKKIQA